MSGRQKVYRRATEREQMEEWGNNNHTHTHLHVGAADPFCGMIIAQLVLDKWPSLSFLTPSSPCGLRFYSSSFSSWVHCECFDFVCFNAFLSPLRPKCTICQLLAPQLQINHMVAVTLHAPHTHTCMWSDRWRDFSLRMWLAGGWSYDCGLWHVSEGDRQQRAGHSRHPSALVWWCVSSQWG